MPIASIVHAVFNTRVVKASLVSAIAAVTAIYATHGHLSVAQTSWYSDAVGITSPLAGCHENNDSVCLVYPASYPALYLEPLSSMALTVAVDDAAAEISLRPDGYSLRLTGEKAHSAPLLPSKVGFSRTVIGFDSKENALVEKRVHLYFPVAMKHDGRYRLEFPGQSLHDIEFSYKGGAISRTIQVNQVGYLPDSRKIAFVGNWLGTAGPLPIQAKQFEVYEESSGQKVFIASLKSISPSDPWSGNSLYHADFSALDKQGRYFLHINGIGRSDSFTIANHIYAPVYRKTFRLFYHTRNSTDIRTPFSDAGYERPGGIPKSLSGLLHKAIVESPFARNETAGNYRAIEGGWFDAGDYGQYVVNAAPVWHAFAAGHDLMPANFASDAMGIPESGNAMPDIFDELEWGMKWLLAMQDKDDGGVYSRLVPLQWDTRLPHEVNSHRYLFEKTTHATASFAAASAIHARLFAKLRPGRASEVLAAAEAAWKFIEITSPWPEEGNQYQNPKGVHAGEYADKSSLDNRLWAAAELYRTTGKVSYKDAFENLFHKIEIDPTTPVSFKEQALAACWAMVMAGRDGLGINPVLFKELQEILIASADWFLRKSDENPYLAPIHQYIGFTGWGSFAHSTRAVLPLMQAYALTGKVNYRNRATEMTNIQLGANPQSLSYITGVGARYPKHPLSKLSQYDGNEEPLAGIPVNGPHYHLPEIWNSTRSVNAAYLPAEKAAIDEQGKPRFGNAYPVMRRYVDSSLLPPMSEPTIAEYARTAVAFGLLSQGDDSVK